MRRAHGFSLVELMVAITLALIVTAAVISVFVGSRTAYEATTGVAALTDSGRTAANFIQEAGRIAGYMACTEAGGTLESSYNSPVQNQLNLP
ncbi:MAG TPA: prepilin-type N-terminal cleavage/methylation domain-containing protein, partial [Steroidobacteraceae bacterium]|nr:prepilin-type N-terminal cleavage/methylation domain-containing protein [Steroidobacteraceae bacterium]